MSDSHQGRSARTSLEQLRKQAKELLRACKSNDPSATGRFAAFRRPPAKLLADAQWLLAREHGFDSWPAMQHHFHRTLPDRLRFYRDIAGDIEQVCVAGDEDALARLRAAFSMPVEGAQLRTHLEARLGAVNAESAQRFVANLYGFADWNELAAGAAAAPARTGTRTTPPFYRVDWDEGWLELRPPIAPRDWDEVLDVLQGQGIAELRCSGQATDGFLQRLSGLGSLRRLQLEGSWQVTDRGLNALPHIPNLRSINLTSCGITDSGLAVLRDLPELREFQLFHNRRVSDAGLENLRHCPLLERVELLGSASGDGALRALAGKQYLRCFKSGDQLTDAGLSRLAAFPVFARWQGGLPAYSLMDFEAEPNYLLLRGHITDKGLHRLRRLDGLFALNIDDARLSFTASGVHALAALPHLGWLAVDADDGAMPAIAALPALRMLMCQDTKCTDAGWEALSRSRTLEYIWGRRCYGLTGRGFQALSKLPALRGLSVSCRNVDDASLALLPQFPSLREFMPMDVPDQGFRHVGACIALESLWCMYCRDTGDEATTHIGSLSRLRHYYAGQTRITDRSLEILSRMESLESLEFWSCPGITNDGIAMLRNLPRLRSVTLDRLQQVTRGVLRRFPPSVRVRLGG
ncbi:MAG: hypothetical protein JNK48_00515 [Bryobacterales bacterium]|nr:hypothetical protein [Bryobacterales bacterium]